ncbi:MAG: coproporphyrinogen dehydrogenase HemZ [Clostridiaceae bacterium]|jgi:coproporphyrinogen dehydrogenase HemZ|nr:coproporphyrinogen dehydrogenase HemZ [Clostridiaceae bacterium]
MIYINLAGEYRVEAYELIRLFIPENEFVFCDSEDISEKDPVLSCIVKENGGKSRITVGLCRNRLSLYNKTMEIDANDDELPKTLKIPVKKLIYEALSEYTGKKLPWGILTGIRPVKIVHSLMDKGFYVDEIRDTLRNYYKISEEKVDLLIEVAQNNRRYLERGKNHISIYIGIPFCRSRCLYCSFFSVSSDRYGFLVQDYLNALKKETDWVSKLIKDQGLIIDTVYIGGGTPTAISDDDFKRLLYDVVPCLSLSNLQEYTVEAGRPDTISREKLKAMKDAGVSRISINPQTMNDETLVLIGRNHTASEVEQAFYMAREENFNNINMDLIAGLPGETTGDFRYTMDRIRVFDPESITVHTMAVKRASRLNEHRQEFDRTGDDEVLEMIETAMSITRDMVMKPYYLYRQKNILANLENAGYAKPGYEGIYNILMMEDVQSIIALGAGAVTKILYPGNRIERIFNVKNVEQYIQRTDEMIERKEKIKNSQ